jgi:hypothetical protein
MKTLIAVISCHAYANTRAQVVRETWAKNVRPDVDLRFFYGYGNRKPASDEVILSADDSYPGLIHKMKSVFRWAVAQNYDAMLKTDDDTFLSKSILQSIDSDPEKDYVGYSTATAVNAPLFTEHLVADKAVRDQILHFGGDYACGGCYRITRRALDILNRTKLNAKSLQFQGIDNLYAKTNVVPCEDWWVGHTLAEAGIEVCHEPSYGGFTDDLDVIKARVEKVLPLCRTSQDLKCALMFAPCLHFNCSEDAMRQRYEKDK